MSVQVLLSCEYGGTFILLTRSFADAGDGELLYSRTRSRRLVLEWRNGLFHDSFGVFGNWVVETYTVIRIIR